MLHLSKHHLQLEVRLLDAVSCLTNNVYVQGKAIFRSVNCHNSAPISSSRFDKSSVQPSADHHDLANMCC